MNENYRSWTWDETVLAFELYCTIPSGKVTATNDKIIALAQAINRTPNSVKLKMQNFKTYDTSYTKNGRIGLSHGSKLDKEVVNQFLNDWNSMSISAAGIKASLHISDDMDIPDAPVGYVKEQTVKVRMGQSFFRRAVLSAYNSKCCITGISIPELLTASHIKPWTVSDDATEKTNPQNGLCLNAFHDRAFDRGFITVTSNYIIRVSSQICNYTDEITTQWLNNYDGEEIALPSRYAPKRELLEYHNDVVFLR